MITVSILDNMIQSDFTAKPDESINLKHFKAHFEKYPERWNTAFKFLIETDLKRLEPGRIELSENVFAAFSEYDTKDPKDALYESHQKYIDLQYLITGEELIGLTNDNSFEVASPYDEIKDITFYNYNEGRMLIASPGRYFIFFPEDIHRPCIKKDKSISVKKVVVKIKYD